MKTFLLTLALALIALLGFTIFSSNGPIPSIGQQDNPPRHQASLVERPPSNWTEDRSGSSTTPATTSNRPPVSSPDSLNELPDSEQQSLWTAFSEARREVRPLPSSRSQRAENLGYDFYALHPKQNMTTRFGSQGVQFVSSDRTYTDEDAKTPATAWQAKMHLLSFAGQKIQLGAPAESSGSRAEYHHRPDLTEWFDNGVEGMEHGYTIATRPAHLTEGEEVTLEVSLNGLVAEPKNEALVFKDGERDVLSYSKLLVIDAHGTELPATMKPSASGFTLAYHDSQATYPVTVDPLIVNEEAKFNRIDSAPGDNFGLSVAIDGDTAVVGSYQDDDGGSNSGSAYVFKRNGSAWHLEAKLTADDATASDNFGYAVSIDGDTVAVGSYQDDDDGASSGSAYVFTRSGISWTQQAKLTADDAMAGDRLGFSIEISGETVVVGAYGDANEGSFTGSAYVFTRSGTMWSQQGKLVANDAAAGDSFGDSVAISGDSVIVGADGDDDAGGSSGSAYVFTRSGSTWSQQAKLTAGDAAASDRFGWTVGISGNSVVIGAFQDDDGSANSGSAYVFTRSGTTWSQQDKLTANDAAASDQFGRAVAIDGNSVVVGAYGDDVGGTDSGSAYVFTRSGSSWLQQDKLTADDPALGDYLGFFSVAISGNSVIVGAHQDDDGGSNSGSAYIFTRSGITWSQQAKLTADDSAPNDRFGFSVAISGDSAVVGTNYDDDGGTNSGSAYVFTRNGNIWSQQAKLTADDAAFGDLFGGSVAISGNSVVVGSLLDDHGLVDSGSAYVFTRSGNTWSQQAKLTANDAAASDHFGNSVAISGDSVVVGVNQDDDDGSNSGSAYVFSRSGNTWSQQAKLTANDAAASDLFGSSVAISSDSVVIGADGDDDGGFSSGSAYVFSRSGSTWSQQAKLTANDAAAGDHFGISAAISGDSVVVGAYADSHGFQESGSAYVFTRSGSTWSQQAKLTADDFAATDLFGISVAISGDSVVVGAYLDDHNGVTNAGSAYVFTRSGSTWSQQAKFIASDYSEDGQYGSSVAISGDSVIIGAEKGTTGAGSVYLYRLSAPAVRDLLAYDHLGLQMSNGISASELPGQLLGTVSTYTFRLGNAGALDLDLQSISLGGADSGQFSLTVPDISSPSDLSTSESLDYTITFSPAGSSGTRTATVIITSNDTNTPVFSFSVSGLGLSDTTDSDADGMTDWPEYVLRGFGFDWTKSQAGRVSDYYALGSTAGFYTQAQVAAVDLSAVLVEVDPINNTAAFKIGLEESSDLEAFTPIIADPAKLSVDGEGAIIYELDASADTKFFRVRSKQ